MNINNFLHLLAFLCIATASLTAGNYFNSSTNENDVAIGGSILRSILENQKEEEPSPAELNIIENISKNENLSTLVKALQAADLTNVLKGNGPFTLFAPTNAAFDQLPPGTLPNLLKPENKSKLAVILTYHIVPGRKTPAMLKTGKLKTLSGKELDVKTEGKVITINGVKLQPPEIVGLNGTIYIVDSVMLPN